MPWKSCSPTPPAGSLGGQSALWKARGSGHHWQALCTHLTGPSNRHMGAQAHIQTHSCTSTHTDSCTGTHTDTFMHKHTYRFMHRHTYRHSCTGTHTNIHAHIHMHPHKHTHQTMVSAESFVGCLTFQQHASVSQGRTCSEKFTYCHTEIEVADQSFYLT